MMEKFKLVDEKINRIDKTLEALTDKSPDSQLKEYVSTHLNKNDTGKDSDKMRGQMNAIGIELINELEEKINALQEQVNSLSQSVENEKTNLQNNKASYDHQLKDLQTNYANSFLQIKNLIEQSKSFANVNDMLKVKNDIVAEFDNNLRDLRIESSIQKKSLDNLKDQLIRILEDKSDQDELQTMKKKIEVILTSLQIVKDLEKKIQIQSKNQFDPTKYVDLPLFNDYRMGIGKDISNLNNNLENLKLLIQDLINNTISNKASFKDLKVLEDSVLSKLEDLKLASIKKFSDKIETNKNFKYLDQQIRHYMENAPKKLEKSESWLLAKKPLGGHLCASCEAYIGDLNDSTQYVPWNRYPSKDPNDKLYRIGNGFSKMLQMVSIENGGVNTKDGVDKNTSANYNSIQEFYKENKIEREINKGEVENNFLSKREDNNSINKSMGLPKIKGKGKIIDSSDYGRDEVLGDKMEDQLEDEDTAKDKPKIMKIFKKNKIN